MCGKSMRLRPFRVRGTIQKAHCPISNLHLVYFHGTRCTVFVLSSFHDFFVHSFTITSTMPTTILSGTFENVCIILNPANDFIFFSFLLFLFDLKFYTQKYIYTVASKTTNEHTKPVAIHVLKCAHITHK